MECPRDNSPLKTERYEAHVEVDVCQSCHGVWLDRGELEQIQKNTDRDYSRELTMRPDPVAAALNQARQAQGSIHCPQCGVLMEAREYAYCSQVIVDTCTQGCGVWLDAGELQELEKFFEREQQRGVVDKMEYLWVSLLSVFQPRHRR